MFCVKCKQQTETNNIEYIITKNGRHMKRGKCALCGTTKTNFTKAVDGGDLVSTLSNITSNIKLPGQKFPGEMHLPGMNFAGPGTRHDLRLNDDKTPKVWSQPIDRVDKSAYLHDLNYEKYSDTANRNIADRQMLSELDAIQNPTLREKLERAVIKPIIATKAKFGLGVKSSPFLEKGRKRRVKR